MRINPIQILLLLLVAVNPAAWADEFSWLHDFSTTDKAEIEPGPVVPFAPRSVVFDDFRVRLETAVSRRDPVAIQALYRIKGAVTQDLKLEIVRWQQRLPDLGEVRVSLMLKELDSLPAKARESWTKIANQLTQGEVTHLVGVSIMPGGSFQIFPLVMIEGKLWIVPSDAIRGSQDIEPGRSTRTPPPSRGR